MKKILPLLVVGLFTFVNASENKIEKTLQGYMSAWNEHNISKIDIYYDENVIWYDLPTDSITKGKMKVTKAITTAFIGNVADMYWVKSGDSFVSNNTITYEWTYGGTFNGFLGDLKIKDKKFSIKGLSTTTINEGGKIIAQKDYYDLHGFMSQLGVVK
jgi:hypothetical protein